MVYTYILVQYVQQDYPLRHITMARILWSAASCEQLTTNIERFYQIQADKRLVHWHQYRWILIPFCNGNIYQNAARAVNTGNIPSGKCKIKPIV